MDLASKTRNTGRLGVVGLATLFALLSGCFTEPVGSETSATGGSCDPGSFNCECVDGGCAPDLRCTESNVCITADCIPGTAICECDPLGRCGVGLECTFGVCRSPVGTTTVTPTSSESNTSTGTSTTTGISTTMPSTTTADTETSTTQVETTASMESSTGNLTSCIEGDLDCPMCFSCTNTVECEAEFDACDAIDTCTVVAECISACAMGVCFENCCAGQPQQLIDAAEALHACRRDSCILSSGCKSFSPIPNGYCGA